MKVTIDISPSAFKRLNNAMQVRIVCGEQWGIIDEFAQKILAAIESGKSELPIGLAAEKREG